MKPAFACLGTSKQRSAKPRAAGLTMVVDGLDSGWLSVGAMSDLLEVAGSYLDLVKIGWLTPRFVDTAYLKRKIKLLQNNGVIVFTGGMLIEAAQLQGKIEETIREAAACGFDAMEVSDSVTQLTPKEKLALLSKVQAAGMRGIVEVGQKGHEIGLTPKQVVPVIRSFLAAGAYKVILESEQVENLFDGSADQSKLSMLTDIAASIGVENLIFEVPYGKPVSDVLGYVWWFVETFGPNVNLANIEPRHLIAVETVRNGYGFRGGFGEVAVET